MQKKTVWLLVFLLALWLLPLAGCVSGGQPPAVKSGPVNPEYQGQPLGRPGKGGEGGDKPRVCWSGGGVAVESNGFTGVKVLL
ncbi:hypothetical protein [Desulfotomaculum copahuensis]|uniref:hypothetical protein n=1 Tax=Desulfotomaculum copahuensis TaxID=1838280 RepID=UPI00082CEA3A|nr:hypothetical protein [Desulfotomaculum copahuensis]